MSDWLTHHLPIWLQAVGAVAQVVIAVIAVALAWQANRLSHDAFFRERAAAELFDILNHARDVRRKYSRLFDEFTNVEEKAASRREWIRARDDVGTRIEELEDVLEGFSGVHAAWVALEEEEDRHAIGDALSSTRDVERAAMKRYERLHKAFCCSVRDAVGALRGSDAGVISRTWMNWFPGRRSLK